MAEDFAVSCDSFMICCSLRGCEKSCWTDAVSAIVANTEFISLRLSASAACPTANWKHRRRRAVLQTARRHSTTMPFSALRKMLPKQTSRKRQYRNTYFIA